MAAWARDGHISPKRRLVKDGDADAYRFDIAVAGMLTRIARRYADTRLARIGACRSERSAATVIISPAAASAA